MKQADAYAAILQAKSLEALNAVLSHYLRDFGFSTFTLTYYSSDAVSQTKVHYDFMSDNIRAWHEYYLAQKFEEVDVELQKARQTNLPIYWELNEQLERAKLLREKRLREDSMAINHVVKGVSIPLHGPSESFAVLLLQQCKKENCLENYTQHLLEWLGFAQIYFDRLRALLVYEQPKQKTNELSLREIQCLQLTDKGYSVNDISTALGISERTVNFHLQNINKKFATKNKHQSVQRAKEKGLI